MDKEAQSITTHAEYLAIFKNGRNTHRVNGIITKIYWLCSLGEIQEARSLLVELSQIIHVNRDLRIQHSKPA